nr:hypothetical protein [Methanobrevibacter arboriphilus]
MYYEYNEKINNIAIHRILAINRGEKEKLLKIKINAPVDDIIEYLNRRMLIDHSNDNFEKNKTRV